MNGIIREKQRYTVYKCNSKQSKMQFCEGKGVNLPRLEKLVWEKSKDLALNSDKLKQLFKQQFENRFIDTVELELELNRLNNSINKKDIEVKNILRKREGADMIEQVPGTQTATTAYRAKKPGLTTSNDSWPTDSNAKQQEMDLENA